MARKAWEAKTEITPDLIKSREKRKWQIALRRYVLERNPSPYYAPYFGLDIENLRLWFENQFQSETGWDHFGKTWQFDHVLPVNCFNFESEIELKLCWNFINLKIGYTKANTDRGNGLAILGAKGYFQKLHEGSGNSLALKMLEKIEALERMETIDSSRQEAFIIEHHSYLTAIQDFATTEFELLNRGRTLEEVKKEAALLKKHLP